MGFYTPEQLPGIGWHIVAGAEDDIVDEDE